MLSVDQRRAFADVVGLSPHLSRPLLRGGDRRIVQTLDKLTRRIKFILAEDVRVMAATREKIGIARLAPPEPMLVSEAKSFRGRRGPKPGWKKAKAAAEAAALLEVAS